jgi:hypothetical protein
VEPTQNRLSSEALSFLELYRTYERMKSYLWTAHWVDSTDFAHIKAGHSYIPQVLWRVRC